MTILEDRLAHLASLPLDRGGHGTFDDGVCVMEAVAYVAGEPHSDHPKCVSPVITAFLVSWNDSLPDIETRDRLLKPLIPLTIGTRTTKKDEQTRAWGERRRLNELDKCVVLCVDCHRKHTAAWRRMVAEERNPCGTPQGYWRGCRCRPCCDARNAYERSRKQAAA